MALTPEERAEKILTFVRNAPLGTTHEQAIASIAAEIASAVAEAVADKESAICAAVEEMQEDRDRWADSACRLEKALEKCRAEAFAEGKRVAYEEAARILASLEGDALTDGELALVRAGVASINARAKELGGGK